MGPISPARGRALLLLALGATLIAIGFRLVLGEAPWIGENWLDLAVSLFVFSRLLRYLALFEDEGFRFEIAIPGLGLSWLSTALYACAAVGGMVAAWWLREPFGYALLFQLMLLFLVLVAGMLASAAVRKRREIGSLEEKVARGGLDALRERFSAMEGAVMALAPIFEGQKRQFLTLKDDARYLSTSATGQAAELEAQIGTELDSLGGLVKDLSSSGGGVLSITFDLCLSRIRELLRRRKAIQEHQSF